MDVINRINRTFAVMLSELFIGDTFTCINDKELYMVIEQPNSVGIKAVRLADKTPHYWNDSTLVYKVNCTIIMNHYEAPMEGN